jgi:hypothetical protein
MLTEQTLEKLATTVVDRFFNEKVALTDGIVDAAQEENLNPEQVKRLVEATNNMTFLRKFNGAQDDEERMSEFEPANASGALQRLIDAAKDLMEETAESQEAGVNLKDPLTLPMTRPDAPPEVKASECECDGPCGEPLGGEPKVKGHVVIMRLRKTAEELKSQHYQKRFEMTDKVAALAKDFMYGADFATFEKDAFYKWGSDAAPFLQLLRRSLRKPDANYDHAAMSKKARVVDSGTSQMQQLSKIMRCSQDITDIEKSQQKVAEYLERLEK